MHKKALTVLLTCFLLIILLGNVAFADNNYVLDYNVKEKEIVVKTKQAELHIAKDYINKDEIYNIANKIEKGIRDLKKYIGEKYIKYDFEAKGKIKYFIQSGDKYSHAIRSSGKIKLYHVHLEQSPYIIVTAKMLLDENNFETPPLWLDLGMANYLSSLFADYPSELIGDKNSPDKLAKEILNNDKYDLVVKYFPKRYYKVSEEKWAFSPLAGSFVKFIKNKYGKEKLLEIYQAKRQNTGTISALENDVAQNIAMSVEQILGTSLDELKEKWLASLQ